MYKGLMSTITLAALLMLCGCEGNAIQCENNNGAMDVSDRFISDHRNNELETIVDSETGVVYLVWIRDGGTAGAKGGITPLLDEDGKVVISEEVDE